MRKPRAAEIALPTTITTNAGPIPKRKGESSVNGMPGTPIKVAATYTSTKAAGARTPSASVQPCAASRCRPTSMARPITTMASNSAPAAASGQIRRRPASIRPGGATILSGEAGRSGEAAIASALGRWPGGRRLGQRVRADRPARRLVDRGRPDRGVLLAHAPVGQEAGVLVTPQLHVHEVLRPRGQRTPADPPRGGLAHLLLEDLEAAPHERLRDAPPLGRVDEAEQDQVAEQHAPVLAEAPGQAAPVDLLGARVDEVRDVGAVVALALHHVGLGPDRLLDRTEPNRLTHHGRGHRVAEPVVVHRARRVARAPDDVDLVVLVALDLAEPVRKGQLGAVAEASLDVRERGRRVTL